MFRALAVKKAFLSTTECLEGADGALISDNLKQANRLLLLQEKGDSTT